MKDILKLGGILFLFTALASAVLAYVDMKTKPLILEQARLEKAEALIVALPMADKSAIESKDGYYIGYKTPEKKEIVGYVFSAFGKGYSSTIETLIGVDTTGAVCGMKVVYQVETPGLGTKIEETRYGEAAPWFQKQFVGKKLAQLFLKKDKPTGEINDVTGATISSRAVTNSVQQTLGKMLPMVGIPVE
jgi:electron transport complex protein RnfG